MAYTNNPHMGKTKSKAVREIRHENSVATVARYYGVHRTTIKLWVTRASNHLCEYHLSLNTRSSVPKKNGNTLFGTVVDCIIQVG